MKKIITSIIIIMTLIPTICFAGNKTAYKLNDNYVAIKNEAFKDLVVSKKMVSVYEEQIKLIEQNLNDLEELSKEKTDAYEKRISNLQLQIEAKDAIIKLKEDNIAQYKNIELLYNNNKSEIRKMKRLNIWEKIFIAGIATYGAIKSEDNGSAIAIGTLGLAGCCINW